MLRIKKRTIYGLGCFTTLSIKRRKMDGEYAGELLRGRRRIHACVAEQAHRSIIKVIWIGDELAIDAEVGGNATAYIHH